MKIRTQLILTMLLFSIVLAAISASAILTGRQVDRASEQEDLADSIGRGASELSYLANDYLIYRESQQLHRWQARFASFSRDVAGLQANDLEQQALVRTIHANSQRLKEVFDSIASVGSRSEDAVQGGDLALLQVSWSRMGVQSQGLISDAARLSQLLAHRVDRLQQMNAVVVIALIGMFGVYFVVNYRVIQRHILASIASLQAGTAVFGSGNLDFRLEEQSDDEIGELSRAFNRMAYDLKAATEEVAEERRRYQELFDFAPDGYVVTDQAGVIHTANRAMGELLAVSAEDLAGQKLHRFLIPADGSTFGAHLAQLGAGGGGAALRSEMRLQSDAIEPISVAVAATASCSATGNVEGLRWLLRDITREKQMHAALVHAEKLSMAGRLAASVAHEINNPLAAALGCAELAIETFDEGQDPSQHLHIVCDALGRAARVVSRLRDLQRPPFTGEKRPADLNELLENVLFLTRKKANSAGVEVSWEPAEKSPWPPVLADGMQQVFLNLVLNAVEAMDGGGRLSVRVRRACRPDRVGVEFADTGPGIPAEVLRVLFEPFNTTKAQGSGLGLFISQKIVQDHGGSIAVDTEESRGSTFTVWLPL